ncbi:MAG: NDP-sugar synthase [Desulfomonile tiedjei]|nr:NDP-sugar synthase [Desulfomonile tiedjei]
MKAMILAAGLGTRLRPLTFERAKPAIPLLGKPILIRLIERLIEDGATEFRINLHHLPHTIEQIFDNPARENLSVSFSHESQILGTAGGLKANEPFFDQGTFLMVNGDIVLEFPLAEAIAFHKERAALATLVLLPQPPPYTYVPVRIDREGSLWDFKETGKRGDPRPEPYLFTGVHILEPEIFNFIPSGIFYEINDLVYPEVIRKGGKVCGFPVQGYWNDLGDPVRYLEAQRSLLTRSRVIPPVFISPEADASDKASVGPFVSVEAGCTLEEGSQASNAVLWENVTLRPGASVTNCIIGSDMIVEGEKVNSIVTRNGERELAWQ